MQMKTVNAQTQGEDRRQRSKVSFVESLQTGSLVVVENFSLTANVQSVSHGMKVYKLDQLVVYPV